MTEVWRAVIGAEHLYEVSDAGRVRSLRKRKRILAPDTTEGYPKFRLWLGVGRRSRQWRYAHRLVAAAFLGPCPKGHQVNHIDGARANSSLSNLEYVTASENVRHSFATSGPNKHSKLTAADVRAIRELRGTATNVALAARFGVQRQTIGDVLLGRRWAWLT